MTNINPEKELLTFFTLTYNQEKYIEETLEGIFNQTYSPLEIIISDDCSTDHTYEIIKKYVSQYKGPHKIIINKNEKNLGLIKHFNKVISMCHGELLVAGAGDDISLPNRIQTLYNRWKQEKDSIMALVSSSYTIDNEGKEFSNSLFENKEDRIEDNFYTDGSWHGACVAYSSKIYNTFGNITHNCYEDMVYFRRALMLGKILFIKDKLVKYRIGGMSTNESNIPKTYKEFKNLKIKELKRNNEVIKQLIEDANKIKNKNIKEGLLFTNKVLEKRIRFYDTNNYLEKLFLLLTLIPYFIVKRKNVIKSFRFKSHHWFRMIRDLLPDYINNIFYKNDFWLKKYIEKNSSNK